MNLTDAIILSVVQALTEFLPISSFGHLVLMENVLGYKSETILFDLMVHLGTAMSVIFYFRNFLIEIFKNIKILKLILISTISTALPAIFILETFRSNIKDPKFVSIFFFITALTLFIMDRIGGLRKGLGNISHRDAIIIGVAQSLAVLPGISRTGITTFSALILGIKREDAAKYSLILAIPTIFGATFFEFMRYGGSIGSVGYMYIAGFFFSFIFGLVSIKVFIETLLKKKFKIFGIYCIIVSLVSIFI